MGLGALKVDSVENKQLLEKFMANTEVSLNLIIEKLCLGVERVDTAEIPDSLLPIKDHAQMDELEEKIGADPVFKRALIRKLSTFGGVNANKTVRTMSMCMFEDTLLLEYSWFGSATKKPFDVYKQIFGVMVEAVRKRFPNFSDAEGSAYIKTLCECK
ncbi:uncharacterized protein LOC129941528 [Eupeodes corollae]|uniref:uncharacterized protein LOC129941528 n=1 Tax=Eupeodes corollae TaxID=290404 RepID=UPI002490CEBC|nr:uncharacterized protein LOC129941528 [Eupeodes corollae]